MSGIFLFVTANVVAKNNYLMILILTLCPLIFECVGGKAVFASVLP